MIRIALDCAGRAQGQPWKVSFPEFRLTAHPYPRLEVLGLVLRRADLDGERRGRSRRRPAFERLDQAAIDGVERGRRWHPTLGDLRRVAVALRSGRVAVVPGRGGYFACCRFGAVTAMRRLAEVAVAMVGGAGSSARLHAPSGPASRERDPRNGPAIGVVCSGIEVVGGRFRVPPARSAGGGRLPPVEWTSGGARVAGPEGRRPCGAAVPVPAGPRAVWRRAASRAGARGPCAVDRRACKRRLRTGAEAHRGAGRCVAPRRRGTGWRAGSAGPGDAPAPAGPGRLLGAVLARRALAR